MFNQQSHAQNILETGIATVTSSGHWFNINRGTIEELIPELLKDRFFETVVLEAVAWVESPDNLTLFLFFGLVFVIDAVTAMFISLLFYFFWYTFKSYFVCLVISPLMRLLSSDLLQISVAAVALSFLGMAANYIGLLIGIVYFFLFKVGLMRMTLNWLNKRRVTDTLPLNDKLFCRLLHRYSRKERYATVPVSEIEKVVRGKLSDRK